MTTKKEQTFSISASVAVSWITLGLFAWLFAEPMLVASVSSALADDIKQTVDKSVAPITGAFIALLVRDINATKREIATLEFRKLRESTWTTEDAVYLADKEIELGALLEAKGALEAT